VADLRAATSAKDIVAGQPRVLQDSGRECMVVDLAEGQRLVFAPNHTKNPVSSENSVDWTKVTRIKLLRIENQNV
jgi:hypothetical protein